MSSRGTGSACTTRSPTSGRIVRAGGGGGGRRCAAGARRSTCRGRLGPAASAVLSEDAASLLPDGPRAAMWRIDESECVWKATRS